MFSPEVNASNEVPPSSKHEVQLNRSMDHEYPTTNQIHEQRSRSLKSTNRRKHNVLLGD